MVYTGRVYRAWVVFHPAPPGYTVVHHRTRVCSAGTRGSAAGRRRTAWAQAGAKRWDQDTPRVTRARSCREEGRIPRGRSSGVKIKKTQRSDSDRVKWLIFTLETDLSGRSWQPGPGPSSSRARSDSYYFRHFYQLSSAFAILGLPDVVFLYFLNQREVVIPGHSSSSSTRGRTDCYSLKRLRSEWPLLGHVRDQECQKVTKPPLCAKVKKGAKVTILAAFTSFC